MVPLFRLHLSLYHFRVLLGTRTTLVRHLYDLFTSVAPVPQLVVRAHFIDFIFKVTRGGTMVLHVFCGPQGLLYENGVKTYARGVR